MSIDTATPDAATPDTTTPDTTTTAPIEQGTERATRREWLGLGILALPTLLISLDVSVLYVALPTLSRDLHASSTQQLWILDIYSFLLAGLLVTAGGLADRLGARRLLLTGATAFGLISVAAAFSQSAGQLIATRALLGVAGATLMPSTMALIRRMFRDPGQMGQAISIWMACFMGGLTAGPIIGGVLLEHFWWGSAFLMGVPIMAVLVVVGPRYLPETTRGEGHDLPDVPSVALSLVTILPGVYGLKEFTRGGNVTGATLAVVVAVVAGTVFIRRQHRLADPLVDLALFRNRAFSAGLSSFLVTGVVMAGVSFAAAIYLQLVLQLTPLQVGLWLIPQNVVMLAGNLIAPHLAAKVDALKIVTGGLAVAGTGLLLLGLVDTDSLALYLTAMVITCAGVSVSMALAMNVVMASAPPERAGSAASIAETGGELGIALGVALMGSLATLVYRLSVAGSLPASVPSHAAAEASESITQAAAVAATTPSANVATQILDAAGAAFATGFNTVGVLGGAALLVAAWRTRVVLGRQSVPATDEAPVALEPMAA